MRLFLWRHSALVPHTAFGMLDLTRLAERIAEAGRWERERQEVLATEADRTAEIVRHLGEDAERQAQRIRAARTHWLVAHAPYHAPSTGLSAPPLPAAWAIVAADGSQIAPDRHEGTVGGCCLLNVGRVVLRYGNGVRARLDSVAEVLLLDEDAEEDEGAGDADRHAAAGLGTRRFAYEMNALAGLIGEIAAEDLPALALTDGSLIAWHLHDETGQDNTRQEAFAALLAALEASRNTRVPLVGYVSSPGSRDVVNGLRVTLCPEEPVDCFRCPHPADALPCAPVRRATDAALFARLLAPGERSAVFTAQGQARGFSRILPLYGAPHWIAFFYLHVGAEVARIELPAWAAADTEMVDRVHTLCLDQARKGRGYPVALAEAHEQAVVRGADRQAFLRHLERARVQEGAAAPPSRKALAKRTRSV